MPDADDLSVFRYSDPDVLWRPYARAFFRSSTKDMKSRLRLRVWTSSPAAFPDERLSSFDWTELHRQELMENWQKAKDHLPLDNIKPLE